MFHYRLGLVETSIPCTRPTWEKAINYFNYIKNNSNILDKYNLYIRGGFLYDIDNTWDIDITMTGSYQQVSELEKDLNYLLDISLNHFEFVVDVKWGEELFPPYTYEDAINPEYKTKCLPRIHIINCYVTRNGITRKLDKLDMIILEQLSKNVILREYHFKPKDKFLKKVIKNPDKIIAQSIEVKEFIQMSREEFYQKTNHY
jgi:hypothetical protein